MPRPSVVAGYSCPAAWPLLKSLAAPRRSHARFQQPSRNLNPARAAAFRCSCHFKSCRDPSIGTQLQGPSLRRSHKKPFGARQHVCITPLSLCVFPMICGSPMEPPFATAGNCINRHRVRISACHPRLKSAARIGSTPMASNNSRRRCCPWWPLPVHQCSGKCSLFSHNKDQGQLATLWQIQEVRPGKSDQQLSPGAVPDSANDALLVHTAGLGTNRFPFHPAVRARRSRQYPVSA